MSDSLSLHYRRLYERHGDSHRAVQYSSARSQRRRFEVLLQISDTIDSVLDVGCGLGHLFAYLRDVRRFRGRYLGVDLVPEFIERCRAKFDAPDTRFLVMDAGRRALPRGYEFHFLSGAFNVRTRGNRRTMLEIIDNMFTAARRGVAFNALTTYVDYREPHLYYSDPKAVFDHCKRSLTRKVVLRHEYLLKPRSIPFEYTLYLYK